MRIKLAICLLLLNFVFTPLAFGAAATMYVTVAGAGDKSGSSWANAMGFSEWTTDRASAEAGDIYYIAGGTYTFTGNSQTYQAGTAASPISFIGVKSTTTNEPPILSDHAFGNDRPLLACGGYYVALSGDGGIKKNLRFTTTNAEGTRIGSSSYVYNCYSYNSSGSAYPAFLLRYHYTTFINNEAQSTNGAGIQTDNTYELICIGNYVHDSVNGIVFANHPGNHAINNIIDTCSNVGIYMVGRTNSIIGNTIYGCGTGVSLNGTSPNIVVNNIFDGNTTGLSDNSSIGLNYLDYNCWDNTTDVSNATKGLNDITGDPGMTNPSSGDFTLGSGSNCIDAGMQVGTNQGATGDYKVNIGADQDDNTAAGGGGGGSGWWSDD